MEKPLEIHDLGIEPLDELLTPLIEETTEPRDEGSADAVHA
jgi:hypothetical protein